jgi:hypothetical protein
VRYFDGNAWTDYISDAGQVSEVPLGPVPPGMLSWFPPEIMVRTANPQSRLVEVPHAKMWILAGLSAFVFWLHTPGTTIVFPLGVLFAVWCWRTTSAAFKSHAAARSPALGEIRAARWVAVGLAVFSLLQAAIRVG